jgi:hypothetical protein
MATYKEIKGVTIQTLDSDPVENVNSWSSGGSMTTDRMRMGGDGTQTALIVAGGTTPSPSDQKALTETYNGTSFTEVNDLNTGRTDLALAGTTTAALAATGSAATGYGTFVESWNGSSWTETTENNTARVEIAGLGIQTAMVIAGGKEPSISNKTEYWNGSSWTEVNNLNTAREGLTNCGAGLFTAGMAAGGNTPPYTGKTETWNATSWTEANDLNEAKELGSTFGTSTSAIYAGGKDPSPALAAVESWDGTSWTETSDLATARHGTSAGGTGNTSGVIAGGSPGAATEEWSLPPPTAAILVEGDAFLIGGTGFKGAVKATSPATTWSSGGSLNTARRDMFGIGTGIPTSMVAGGSNPPRVANTEQYNGTAWTEVGDLTEGTTSPTNITNGTPLNAMAASGHTGPSQAGVQDSESWNGSSWSNSAELNIAAGDRGGSGTGPAALVFGGVNPSNSNGIADTELYDGTSWSEVNNLNTIKYSSKWCWNANIFFVYKWL